LSKAADTWRRLPPSDQAIDRLIFCRRLLHLPHLLPGRLLRVALQPDQDARQVELASGGVEPSDS
jgi:hypothetical protein